MEGSNPINKASNDLPRWLRRWWWISAPVALAFDLEIIWEKTLLTWDQGPQMIGFSLAHINPLFFMAGILCTYALLLWLVVSIGWLSVKRIKPSFGSALKLVICFVPLLAMFLPDTLILRLKG